MPDVGVKMLMDDSKCIETRESFSFFFLVIFTVCRPLRKGLECTPHVSAWFSHHIAQRRRGVAGEILTVFGCGVPGRRQKLFLALCTLQMMAYLPLCHDINVIVNID